MKFLTTNFLKCSVKACDTSNDNFPLQYDGSKCQLVQDESIEFNPEFLLNIVDRVDWPAVLTVAAELGNNALPPTKPSFPSSIQELTDNDMAILNDLHTLLLQTSIAEGEMKCRNCGHIYYIKNGIPNLLLPPHLV
ncbi:AFH_G0047560.mRNA.1.CDS.1 [Saccharomyces cerevisiae]|nr:AFH_G0047560.mRNA.1.CDS.1 [Saccharomyces cerevisiae]CAI5300367.1 CIC_HP2_G0042630.mRNA.1.CDS.1 [Saccharomyces cerevisiae]CAI6641354.1 CIC_HP2_G0042630.mRNA.1.CDS.1 [Saccharomyces cerevisiae]CAI6653725.1 CIC_HP1_G0044010.mRNA.1.CDS.1 [Saccharomyces cerevisiae]CAI6871001.1 AFH_G0047560.mRNA.1.CDS.1 [Saccharomyces cerevisiae]